MWRFLATGSDPVVKKYVEKKNIMGDFGYEELSQFFRKKNQFAIIDENYEVLSFNSLEAMYLYVMKTMRTYCKRGYVDMVLLVRELTKRTYKECEAINEKIMEHSPMMCVTCIVLDWDWPYKNRRIIGEIIKSLHCITDTKYDYQKFEIAFMEFMNYLKENNNDE